MKTTVEIPDTLLEEAKKVAARHDTTLRALIVEGLHHIVGERNRMGHFKLRKASFKGNGLQPGVADAHWEGMRDRAYEGRGG